MAYNVVYKKSVHRDLKKLPKAEVAGILDQIERELARAPEEHPLLKGQFAGLRKYRIGDYRIVYAILGTDVVVLRIGHRRNVYRKGI